MRARAPSRASRRREPSCVPSRLVSSANGRGRPPANEPACLISSRSLVRGGPGGLAWFGSPARVDIRLRRCACGRAFVALCCRVRCLAPAPPWGRSAMPRFRDLQTTNRNVCCSLARGCARFAFAASGTARDGSRDHPLHQPDPKHRAVVRAVAPTPRFGTRDRGSATLSDDAIRHSLPSERRLMVGGTVVHSSSRRPCLRPSRRAHRIAMRLARYPRTSRFGRPWGRSRHRSGSPLSRTWPARCPTDLCHRLHVRASTSLARSRSSLGPRATSAVEREPSTPRVLASGFELALVAGGVARAGASRAHDCWPVASPRFRAASRDGEAPGCRTNAQHLSSTRRAP